MTSIAEFKKKRAAKRSATKSTATKSKGKMPMKDGKPAFLSPTADTPRGKRRARLEDKEATATKKSAKLTKRGDKVAATGGDRSKLDKRANRQTAKASTARKRLTKMDQRDSKCIARAKKRMAPGLGSGMTDKPTKGRKPVKRKTAAGPIGRGPKKNNRGTTMKPRGKSAPMKKAVARKQARRTRRRTKK